MRDKSPFVFVTLLLLLSGAHAAETTPQLSHPDLSGIWMNDDTLDETLKRLGKKRLAPGETLGTTSATGVTSDILTEEYLTIYEQRRAAKSRLAEGAAPCELPGLPVLLTYPYPFEILQTPGRLTMIFEADSQVRRIFLDRNEHLPYDELDPSYNGDSIGHWDADTLVIDTTGFHDHTELWGGLPHSEALHIVERISFEDEDTIHNDVTIYDPLALKDPISRSITYSKRPDWRIREYSCLENNRDQPDAEGNRAGGLINN